MPKPLSDTDRVHHYEHVSASQLGMLFTCEQRFAFKYGMRLPDIKTGSLALGIAIDTAVETFNRAKMASHENGPMPDVVEQAVASLEGAKDNTKWDVKDPFAGIKDEIPGMVKVLYDGMLTQIQPIEVQSETTVEMDNWHLIQKVDVKDDKQVSHDVKTAKKSWSEDKPMTERQPVIYTLHEPGDSLFKWDIAVRNKTPKLQQLARVVTQTEKDGMRLLAGKAKHRMDFLKINPDVALPTGYGGWLCSHRLCPFAVQCEERWKQPVRE